MAPTMNLPEYHEWMSTDQWRVCLLSHYEAPEEGCPGCVARTMLPAIHQVWTTSNDTSVLEAIYALQDGYGAAGYVPSQGYDWSGIRDSSPAAVQRMFVFVTSLEA